MPLHSRENNNNLVSVLPEIEVRHFESIISNSKKVVEEAEKFIRGHLNQSDYHSCHEARAGASHDLPPRILFSLLFDLYRRCGRTPFGFG